jgi:transcriptional regulator with XRE-family HTH domain
MENGQSCEIGIGKRLREFRESLNVGQTALALAIGISRERLASYESGRVPLRWGVFLSIMKRFHLNPLWLATGRYLRQVELPSSEMTTFEQIDGRKRFSDAVLALVNDAGTPERFETEQKINRVSGLISEIINDAVKNRASQELSEGLKSIFKSWVLLGAALMADTGQKTRKREAVVSLANPKA